jgi:hypothetical protein
MGVASGNGQTTTGSKRGRLGATFFSRHGHHESVRDRHATSATVRAARPGRSAPSKTRPYRPREGSRLPRENEAPKSAWLRDSVTNCPRSSHRAASRTPEGSPRPCHVAPGSASAQRGIGTRFFTPIAAISDRYVRSAPPGGAHPGSNARRTTWRTTFGRIGRTERNGGDRPGNVKYALLLTSVTRGNAPKRPGRPLTR